MDSLSIENPRFINYCYNCLNMFCYLGEFGRRGEIFRPCEGRALSGIPAKKETFWRHIERRRKSARDFDTRQMLIRSPCYILQGSNWMTMITLSCLGRREKKTKQICILSFTSYIGWLLVPVQTSGLSILYKLITIYVSPWPLVRSDRCRHLTMLIPRISTLVKFNISISRLLLFDSFPPSLNWLVPTLHQLGQMEKIKN